MTLNDVLVLYACGVAGMIFPALLMTGIYVKPAAKELREAYRLAWLSPLWPFVAIWFISRTLRRAWKLAWAPTPRPSALPPVPPAWLRQELEKQAAEKTCPRCPSPKAEKPQLIDEGEAADGPEVMLWRTYKIPEENIVEPVDNYLDL